MQWIFNKALRCAGTLGPKDGHGDDERLGYMDMIMKMVLDDDDDNDG